MEKSVHIRDLLEDDYDEELVIAQMKSYEWKQASIICGFGN